MKKLMLVIPTMVMLSACGAPSVEKLIENPQLLGEISQKCTMMMAQGKDTNTDECNNARKATEQMTKNIMNGVQQMIPR